MGCLAGDWETARCRVLKAHEQDTVTLASIFADNADAIRSQGPDCEPERLASCLLRHEALPPGVDSSQEQTFLIADKASNATIGLLACLCGYPTMKTIYIGSLFFRRDWQGQGLGREIVEELERHAVRRGFETARVAVGLRNWPALRFWNAVGFNNIMGISGETKFGESAYADLELDKPLN